MKKYLENLCDDIDCITTKLEGENDWQEQVLGVIYNNLSGFHNYTEGSLEDLLQDMKEGMKL